MGYKVDLTYVWLRDVELAIQRVAARVRAGGHDVPEPTIRRRYRKSLQNVAQLYLPQADTWHVYENSDGARLIAEGGNDGIEIYDAELWSLLAEG